MSVNGEDNSDMEDTKAHKCRQTSMSGGEVDVKKVTTTSWHRVVASLSQPTSLYNLSTGRKKSHRLLKIFYNISGKGGT